jgi:hypothetical protein
MRKYWALWKRGWWAWLLMLCMNLSFAVFVIPLAAAFHDNLHAYWVSAAAVWCVIGAPVWGWIFEWFAGASSRIGNEGR